MIIHKLWCLWVKNLTIPENWCYDSTNSKVPFQ